MTTQASAPLAQRIARSAQGAMPMCHRRVCRVLRPSLDRCVLAALALSVAVLSVIAHLAGAILIIDQAIGAYAIAYAPELTDLIDDAERSESHGRVAALEHGLLEVAHDIAHVV